MRRSNPADPAVQSAANATASTQTVRQDGVWAAAASATLITHELDGSPRHPPVTNLYYPGAGHGYFGLPPYYPFFTDPDLGGSVQANAVATEQFWTRMPTFLNHL